MENPKIYIILSRSGTLFARIIRFYTHKYYNHASLAFEPGAETVYSYGRRYPRLWFPGGFIIEGCHRGYFKLHPEMEIIVLEAEITPAQLEAVHAKLAPMIARPRAYKYQLSAVYYTMRHRPCDRLDKFVCSGFIAYALQGILPIREHYSQVMPCDFMKLGLNVIYKGAVGDYKSFEQRRKAIFSE